MKGIIFPASRRLVTTRTGSRYALAKCQGDRWWVQPRARRIPGSPIVLADAWRPIATPKPWPPRRNQGLVLEFLDARRIRLPSGTEVWIGGELRYTSDVRRVVPWDPRAAWPGPIAEVRA